MRRAYRLDSGSRYRRPRRDAPTWPLSDYFRIIAPIRAPDRPRAREIKRAARLLVRCAASLCRAVRVYVCALCFFFLF